ncbi:MAG: ABC transporter permease [Chloroherpetonaceae bacterium]
MSVFSLVLSNIAQRKISVFLTALSVALGVALIAATLDIKRQVEEKFSQTSVGYELILGAKGSPLQLVLNTVYHLGNPTGNLPYSTYEMYRRSPFVSYAIPMGLGDNYRGFRIVCTTTDFFTKFNYAKDKRYELTEGRLFNDDELYAAVLGKDVAEKTGLKLGDKFVATHGLQESGGDIGKQHEHDQFTVVGILKKSGTPADKAIYASLPTVWAIHEEETHHDDNDATRKEVVERIYGKPEKDTIQLQLSAKDHHHETHTHSDGTPHTDGDKHADHDHAHEREHHHDARPIPTEGDVTAILVKAKAPIFSLQLYDKINREPHAQAAFAVNEIKNLFDIVGNIDWAFLFITALVIVVALIGVMVALYNSLAERRREIAILRSLGAHRSKIFSIIALEAALVSFFGALFGVVLSKVLALVLKGFVLEKTGIEISVSLWSVVGVVPVELGLLVVVTLIGALAGLLPAVEAYRTDVAKNLSPVN